MATCVNTNKFLPSPRDWGEFPQGAQRPGDNGGQYVGDALREIGQKKAGIAVSRADGSQVIGLNALEVDVGVRGGDDEGKVQQQRCKDCYGMQTRTAPPDADFMNIEATLMATAAMAGIIWVTVFAG